MAPAFDEAVRMARLRALQVLDSTAEPLFDSLVKAASMATGRPISLVSLVDSDRQWFKASVGLGDVTETSRDIAFCAHTIQSDELFEVQDASLDKRFAVNALVTGDPSIRFYAGAPLILPGGERMGSLCVIDQKPGKLTATQRLILIELANIASLALEQRQVTLEYATLVESGE